MPLSIATPWQIVSTIVVTSLLSLAVSIALSEPIRRMIAPRPRSEDLVLGCGYFLGRAAFLSAFRILSVAFSPQYACWIATSAVVFLVFVYRKAVPISLRQFGRRAWLLIPVLVIVFVYQIGMESDHGTFGGFSGVYGSLHTGRYSNIVSFIVANNTVPTLGQSYGQSLFSASSYFLGGTTINLSLHIQLVWAMFFLLLATRGVFGLLSLTARQSWMGTAFVLFGSSTVSFYRISTIDSGAPFLSNGYSDTLFSIGALVIAFAHAKATFQRTIFDFMAVLALALASAMSAPQTGLFLLCVYSLVAFQGKCPWSFAVLCATGLCVGSLFGGLLCPPAVQSRDSIPGIQNVQRHAPMISLRPGLTHTRFQPGANGPFLRVDPPQLPVHDSFDLVRILWRAGLDSAGLFILPLLGLAGLILGRKAPKYDGILLLFTQVGLFLLISIAFPLSIYAWKNPLSRFCIPFYFFGMIGLFFSIVTISRAALRRQALVGLFLLATTGNGIDFTGLLRERLSRLDLLPTRMKSIFAKNRLYAIPRGDNERR
ncbi:MAG: hypothetical protein HYR96_05645 [Deltaproteobacteria bacterium]|nr:hypothetical protein [Deltaproteobacteria bacterium]MBI3295770.1 hypothetical protein [Deltaproteobacteria bacterium]